MADSLQRYRSKRDFTKTAEPNGGRGRSKRAPKAVQGHIFVVQKHSARRLHYDFRLALDGVLKSWAVTRGPSLIPGEKRLAVHVEDHPYDYAGFEGVIPEGQYGAGPVIVWDRGHWLPDGDPHKALKKGHLTFTLEGEKLNGRWHLVRMRPREHEKQEPWLLIKADDEAARPKSAKDILKAAPQSVVTGRSIEDVEAGKKKPARRTAAARTTSAPRARGRTKKSAKSAAGPKPRRGKKAKDGERPGFVEPCLATLVAEPPAGAGWVHEIKFDGYRTEALIEGGKVRFLTRTGLDWTKKFGRLAEVFRTLDLDSAVVDGEIVVETGEGASDFTALQAALKVGDDEKLVYYAFDLLFLDGEDLRALPLVERKERLAALLDGAEATGSLRYSTHFDEDGELLLKHACKLTLEGIVSKQKDAAYRSGRGGDWLKSKCSGRQEFAIVGFSPSKVAAKSVGALAVGYYEGRDLLYAGRIGTGFTQKTAAELWRALAPLKSKRPEFRNAEDVEAPRSTVWVKPELVAEVEYRGWTGSNVLRHAAFKGLREDKRAKDVVREDRQMAKAAKGAAKRKKASAADPLRERLTHPDKMLWSDAQVTKLELAQYYEEVWDWIAPYVVGRPLALVRCPDGAEKTCFFQKHAWAGLDESAVHRHKIGKEEVLTIEDFDGLIALVQAGVLEIHPWGATVDNIDRPDHLTFDLDPGEGVSWKAVIEGAREVKARLEGAGLAAFLKNTGGKGLHVVTPLKPTVGWDEAKSFAKALAEEMETDDPERFIATASKRERKGRIFVDYLRNGRGATAVAAYSTRARPGAAVSTPLDWDELSPRIRADHYTVNNIPKRLSKLGGDPWASFRRSARALPAAAREERPKRRAHAR